MEQQETGNVAIKVESVSKNFKLPHEKNSSIKSAVIKFYRRKKTYEVQNVLKSISFEVYEGDFFGIVGKNGSGKSTILKLLAGIYTPTKGEVHISGKLTPFIELGVGFNPELTGRENVYLNGALLGFSRKEMRAMYQDIVDFAEIEKFMDQKLKNYSSGMQVRLAFSIAIQAQSDILLFDEVLAVGDAAFQAKCYSHFEKLKKNGKTIVFVTHDMEAVRRFCNRAIMLENGKIIASGDVGSVVDSYLEANINKLDNEKPFGVEQSISTDKSTLKIMDVWAEEKNIKKDVIKEDAYSIAVKIKFLKNCTNPIPGVILRNQQGLRVTASNTAWVGQETGIFKAGDITIFKFHFPNVLEHGAYYISANVLSSDDSMFFDWENDLRQFSVKRLFLTGGLVNPKYRIEVIDE
jgi:ABC-2 type transport system ATP-binding protein